MQIMVNNKAQMKIQQMAFMLIAVTILFIMVGMIFIVFRFSGLKNSATNLEMENAMKLSIKLANSPEFSCGESFGNLQTNCIDLDKAMALRENIKLYKEFWSVSDIEIIKIYPNEDLIKCNMANYPDCNDLILINSDSNGYSVSNFVALCRKYSENGEISNKCEIGKILVRYKEK